MPRRNRPHASRKHSKADAESSGSESSSFGWATTRSESGPAGAESEQFTVRTVPGSRATKPYRCPGCDHEIAPGTPHIVAWSTDVPGGADDRRHWHNGCWSARARRGPTRRWS
ncbi:ATP/GTP-binding protein [Rhodococcus sp. SJ-3]|uniref:ATP/GTP-binding protein n=1 Tax=Rhodococcus sp. SJ-3 TaxID=3454628 RepID=UPI003F7AC6C6